MLLRIKGITKRELHLVDIVLTMHNIDNNKIVDSAVLHGLLTSLLCVEPDIDKADYLSIIFYKVLPDYQRYRKREEFEEICNRICESIQMNIQDGELMDFFIKNNMLSGKLYINWLQGFELGVKRSAYWSTIFGESCYTEYVESLNKIRDQTLNIKSPKELQEFIVTIDDLRLMSVIVTDIYKLHNQQQENVKHE